MTEPHQVWYDGDQDVHCSCGLTFGAGDGYTSVEEAMQAAENHQAIEASNESLREWPMGWKEENQE